MAEAREVARRASAAGERAPPPPRTAIDACLLLLAVQRRRATGRVPGLRGAFIIASTPCSCVGVLGTNITVLLACSRSRLDSVAFLPSLLT